ncbi:SPOR domain-containing protein [Prevotella sp. 10(H)]|uniref:HU domain-containing protein n=1 Tax=Prevotella sp. 10(H) TaxID=1158294 RepID=UPI0004A76FBF|nr:SPOR domain-containing protein [Prevotella sp. 10(H)]
MEKILFKYLEHLLPIHNCVIIPDLGGFILNMEPALFLSDGRINPPRYSIVFNPDLNYNDGIIATHITKIKSSSYNSANKQIKSFVKAIKADLKTGKTILCGNLGSFTADSSLNIIFTPNKSLIYPALWGLNSINIRHLSEINQTTLREKRNIRLRYTAGRVAAAVAAIAFFIIPINIEDSNSDKTTQQASFISTINSSLTETAKTENNVEAEKITANTALFEKPIENEAPKAVEEKKKSNKSYYIIVGGEVEESQANRLLKKIREQEFEQAKIIECWDRYRIYVASFDDKNEAETFLTAFRKEHPKYEAAWLYPMKNK